MRINFDVCFDTSATREILAWRVVSAVTTWQQQSKKNRKNVRTTGSSARARPRTCPSPQITYITILLLFAYSDGVTSCPRRTYITLRRHDVHLPAYATNARVFERIDERVCWTMGMMMGGVYVGCNFSATKVRTPSHNTRTRCVR